MKLNVWQLKMENYLHTIDPSLKKESNKHKKNKIKSLKKLNSYLELIKKRGIKPSFFYKELQ